MIYDCLIIILRTRLYITDMWSTAYLENIIRHAKMEEAQSRTICKTYGRYNIKKYQHVILKNSKAWVPPPDQCRNPMCSPHISSSNTQFRTTSEIPEISLRTLRAGPQHPHHQRQDWYLKADISGLTPTSKRFKSQHHPRMIMAQGWSDSL